jgi:hypothetical protein
MPAHDLMYIAGHKNIATTMKYIHLAGESANRSLSEARQKGEARQGGKKGDREFLAMKKAIRNSP